MNENVKNHLGSAVTGIALIIAAPIATTVGGIMGVYHAARDVIAPRITTPPQNKLKAAFNTIKKDTQTGFNASLYVVMTLANDRIEFKPVSAVLGGVKTLAVAFLLASALQSNEAPSAPVAQQDLQTQPSAPQSPVSPRN
jgi:hypothetical protein